MDALIKEYQMFRNYVILSLIVGTVAGTWYARKERASQLDAALCCLFITLFWPWLLIMNVRSWICWRLRGK